MPTVPLLFASNLVALRSVRHGFTTRLGGVSRGPWGPLALAPHAGVATADLATNWGRVAATLDPSLDARAVALLHQVHGADVVEVSAPGGPHEVVAAADAAFTFASGVVLAVRVADCVPVLLAGDGVVAVAHSGWRGTAADVVGALIAALAERGVAPGSLSAATGPCISGLRYEVGEEVVEGLRDAGVPPEVFLWSHGPGRRPHVDLGRTVRWQLRQAGIGRVGRTAGCSLSDPCFHSHRRDGARSGRMAGVIVRVP